MNTNIVLKYFVILLFSLGLVKWYKVFLVKRLSLYNVIIVKDDMINYI
jgi:hypothetical protein